MRAIRITIGSVLALALTGCASQPTVRAQGDNNPPPVPAPVQTQSSDKPSAAPVRQTVFGSVREPFNGVPGAEVAVRIRAQVNGVPIFDEEVRQGCLQLLRQTMMLPEPERANKQKEIIEKQLEGLIDQEVVIQDLENRLKGDGPRAQYMDKLKQAAKKEFKDRERQIKAQLAKAGINCQSDEDLRKALKDQGLSLDFLRRQSERQFIALEYMRSRIFSKVDRLCGHEQIVEYYQAHGNEFDVPDSVKWHDIFIDAGKFPTREEARRRAEQVAALFRAGEPIAKLLQYDNGDSSYRNGDGYGQRHGEIKPLEAEAALFRLRDGEVGPIIEVPSGFHVIRLVKRTYAGRKPLDEDTQTDIRKKLQREVGEREYKNMLADMRRHATIEISPP